MEKMYSTIQRQIDIIKEDAYKEGHAAGYGDGQEAGQRAGQEIGQKIGLEIGQEIGQKDGRRQDIMDLLEDWGEIPSDICACIYAEEDIEVLRKWHKAAARTENFEDFRAKMQQR